MDSNSLIEGRCKFRDGKRWKTRWAVITKLSPVADCLQLQIYRDEKDRARNGQTKASLSLQHFLASESGFTLDKESQTLAIICQDLNVVLAFDNRERLIEWNVRIANNLGEGHQFLVQLASAPVKSKLTPGPVKLHVTDKKFCLTGGIPPKLLGAWEVSHLRRYGIVEGRFVFEGGSRCGKGEGVHVLVPDPPQIHQIVDAFDMSTKGQLTRMPSRRFGTDSPRKCMNGRLPDLRNMSMMSAESSPNVSCMGAVTPTNPPMGLSLMQNMTPAPKESLSAEELCHSCTDSNPMDHSSSSQTHQNSFWSSDSSSRCDLDSVDNVSMINGETRDVKSPTRMSSPVKNHTISKPLPSAMERCLSCMSKLGSQGGGGGHDVLSPSWTMDLNNVSNTMSTSQSQSHVVQKCASVGSGNSDRLSISSHGSSGGVTEFYYDTPRSVLIAEMRRHGNNGRSNTPPAPPHASTSGLSFNLNNTSQGEQQCYGGGSHSSDSHSGGFHTHFPTASSPQRHPLPLRNGCGFNGCHCHGHGQPGNYPTGSSNTASQHHQQGPVYYNTAEDGSEQQFQGKACPGKAPINLHPTAYENYDFPRCVSPHQSHAPSQGHYCASHNGSKPSNGPSPCNNIDWSKKHPMDRGSIASTSVMGSEMSEYYDTPRRFNESCPPSVCCSHQNQNGRPHMQNVAHCPCCTPHGICARSESGMTSSQQSCHSGRRIMDPLENYDIPPCSHPLSPPPGQGSCKSQITPTNPTPNTNLRLNGEGKMPLVTGNMSCMRNGANSIPIYAQVDKSKKTPRVNPSTSSVSNCDMQHIYQNAQQPQQQQQPHTFPQQPNYMNIEHVLSLPPKKSSIITGHPSNLHCTDIPSGANEDKVLSGGNYINMDFSESLCLYENSKDVRSSRLELSGGKDSWAESKLPVSAGQQKEKDLVVSQNRGAESLELSVSGVKSGRESGESTARHPDKHDALSKSTIAYESSSSSSSNKNHHSGDDRASLPLRRSSSVPCKGGHANRGSASSCDSGVSGDEGLFFEDGSALGDFRSLCLHESLPRKNQRSSPSSSSGSKNTPTTSTPKPQDSVETDVEMRPESASAVYSTISETLTSAPDANGNTDSLANRHYETIDEVDPSKVQVPSAAPQSHHHHLQRPKNHSLSHVSDANSMSSGASDMSDYIETLSSCSRGSNDTVNNPLIPVFSLHQGIIHNAEASAASPKRSSSMKPRSGKEYLKIDRSAFTKND